MEATPSEVFEWLKTISSGLQLERLATEFEIRGFTTRKSLKYVEKNDLDTFFPSPEKLLLAEKRILETEIENLKANENVERCLQPRELFPPTHPVGHTASQAGHTALAVYMAKQLL